MLKGTRGWTAFTQALQQSGWTVGQNVRIDYRWGPGNPATMRKHATELIALEPDVVLALTTVAVGPLLEASRTVPIVFVTVADPVAAGYVETLARPGGNATGFTPYEYSISGKWLELLKEIAPRVTRAAVLRDASIGVGLAQFAAIQALAPSLGVELRPVDVRDASEIERARRSHPNNRVSWQIDRVHYRAVPTMSDGREGATLDLRELFEQFQVETTG
jgi:putative ABC transport system substrate-binding protein